MTRRRGGTITFLSVVTLATGVAFAAGSHLRSRFSERIAAHPTQLAQAGNKRNPGGIPGERVRPLRRDDDVGMAPLDTFLQVYTLVRRDYVDKLPGEAKMSHGAIRGMLADLNDPNSRFYEPAERALLDNEARGLFEGIGASLSILPHKRDGYTEHKVTVVAALPGSPAEKAGLRPGDTITRIDGKWVLGSDPLLGYNKMLRRFQARDADEDDLQKEIEAAQERIRGGITLVGAQKKLTTGRGEKRTLSVQRAGVKDPHTVELSTAVTEVSPIVARTLPGGVAYVKVNLFTKAAGAAFKTALASLPKQPGLVLDLRGNPGGLLDPAKEIAATLSRGGKFAVMVGAGGKKEALTTPVGNRVTRPVIVLVDRGTASTAEMLAASLRDKGIGTLLGGRTFGDAMVQTLYPLPDGSAYTLTTGKLLSPSGKEWQTAGLTPGVAVPGGTPEETLIARAVSTLRSRARQVAAAPPAR